MSIKQWNKLTQCYVWFKELWGKWTKTIALIFFLSLLTATDCFAIGNRLLSKPVNHKQTTTSHVKLDGKIPAKVIAKSADAEDQVIQERKVASTEKQTKESLKKPEALRMVRSNPRAGKQIAITFDDGPYGQWTEQYINVLKANNAKATFFLVGKQVEKYPGLARKIEDAGFEVGAHSYSHAKLTRENDQAINKDFQRETQLIKTETGTDIKLFRPPYGMDNDKVEQIAHTHGEQTVCWNIDPRDWQKKSPAQITKHILTHAADGCIIILHEGKQNTAAALPGIIKGLQQKGYTLVTVSELLQAQ